MGGAEVRPRAGEEVKVTSGASKGVRRIMGYGDPKAGKTRLFTALPWGPIWGERAAYVAWDVSSSELGSVLPENRDRLLVITPEAKEIEDPKTKERKLVYDPYEEAVRIARHNWAEDGCGTLIWDTMTKTSWEILSAVAKGKDMTVSKGYASPLTIGDRKSDAFLAQPAPADYGIAQQAVFDILEFLNHQPINVIVLCHSVDDDNQGKGDMIGGPATVGRATIKALAGYFNNLFRVTIQSTKVPGSNPPKYDRKRVVQTEPQSYWMAGFNQPNEKNPIGTYDLEGPGRCRRFWELITDVQEGKEISL